MRAKHIVRQIKLKQVYQQKLTNKKLHQSQVKAIFLKV